MKKELTPLKSVRKKCLWCCDNQPNEVKLCPVTECELYPFRFGKNPNKNNTLKLMLIRQHCIVCSSYSPQEVRECWEKDCSIYMYRLGRNPKLVGRRALNSPFSQKSLQHDAIYAVNTS